MTKKEIASYIDHTLLAPQAGINQILQLCQEAHRYGFASVCVNPIYVSAARTELDRLGASSKVCTVIGFPLGATPSEVKAFETINAIKNGADEVDMVIDVGSVKDGRYSATVADIKCVVDAARSQEREVGKKIVVKVILETCFLNSTEVATACQCAQKAGADFVKTSTGFANPKGIDGNSLPNGASESFVRLMRDTVGKNMGVKASGGIRSARTAINMIEAGANRIGTSSGVAILENWDESLEIKPGF